MSLAHWSRLLALGGRGAVVAPHHLATEAGTCPPGRRLAVDAAIAERGPRCGHAQRLRIGGDAPGSSGTRRHRHSTRSMAPASPRGNPRHRARLGAIPRRGPLDHVPGAVRSWGRPRPVRAPDPRYSRPGDRARADRVRLRRLEYLSSPRPRDLGERVLSVYRPEAARGDVASGCACRLSRPRSSASRPTGSKPSTPVRSPSGPPGHSRPPAPRSRSSTSLPTPRPGRPRSRPTTAACG